MTTGADDYIGEPYEPSYVVARVREDAEDGPAALAIIDSGERFDLCSPISGCPAA